MLHPGAYDCELNRSDTIIPTLTEFINWLLTLPDTQLSVISVPQVVKHECEKVNTGLKELASRQLINFVELTHIQSDLFKRGKRHYDVDTAASMGRLMARQVARVFGVKVVPSKEDAGSEQKKVEKNQKKAGVGEKPQEERFRRGRKKNRVENVPDGGPQGQRVHPPGFTRTDFHRLFNAAMQNYDVNARGSRRPPIFNNEHRPRRTSDRQR